MYNYEEGAYESDLREAEWDWEWNEDRTQLTAEYRGYEVTVEVDHRVDLIDQDEYYWISARFGSSETFSVSQVDDLDEEVGKLLPSAEDFYRRKIDAHEELGDDVTEYLE